MEAGMKTEKSKDMKNWNKARPKVPAEECLLVKYRYEIKMSVRYGEWCNVQ